VIPLAIFSLTPNYNRTTGRHTSSVISEQLFSNDFSVEAFPKPGGARETRRFDAAARSTILYVEDDATLRDAYSEALRLRGYHVDVACDGEAGWQALRLRPYDLLITDNDMPRVTGVELVKRLRSAGNTVPVMMASGYFTATEARENQALELAAVLRKPFQSADLVERVETVLREAQGIERPVELFFPLLAEAFASLDADPNQETP